MLATCKEGSTAYLAGLHLLDMFQSLNWRLERDRSRKAQPLYHLVLFQHPVLNKRVPSERKSALAKPTYNPYDFANPVNDADMFAGRKSERDEVKYYLEHARNAPPIHLAVTGDRAAGKTSMLNLIEREAEQLDFLVVRLDLNENDKEPLQFFGRLYDALLTAAAMKGAYAGTAGQVYKSYRALVDTGVATNLPLVFPGHLVAALVGSGKLSEPILKADLKSLAMEVARPIILILDECNVLTQSRVTLEIIRNVFMNLRGFMLVLAGTPTLFPVIDDVYSPIARQFKKVELSPFEDEDETEECITLPLVRAGLEAEEVFEEWSTVVEDLHRISGGRPYEIQLLCHTMFKRMQQEKESGLVLNLEALETVRKELEQGQGQDLGRVSHLYVKLKDDDLIAIAMLRRVVGGDPRRALDVSIAFPDEEIFRVVPEDVFLSRLDYLVSLGVLVVEDGIYELAGDQFDEVYLRYLGASRDVYIAPRPAPPDVVAHVELLEMLEAPRSGRMHHFWLGLSEEDFSKRITALFSDTTASMRSSALILRDWEKVFVPLSEAQESQRLLLNYLQIRIHMGDLETINHYHMESEETVVAFKNSEEFQALLSRVSSRAGTVTTKQITFDLAHVRPASDILPPNQVLRSVISEQYDDEGVLAYRSGDYASSLRRFQTCYELAPGSKYAVAAAFQLLHLGDWESAIDWTYRADVCLLREGSDEFDSMLLAAFNRAVSFLMLDRLEEARGELEFIVDDGSENGDVFLLVPQREADGNWVMNECSGSIVRFASAVLSQL